MFSHSSQREGKKTPTLHFSQVCGSVSQAWRFTCDQTTHHKTLPLVTGYSAGLQLHVRWIPLPTRQTVRHQLWHGRQSHPVWQTCGHLQVLAHVEGQGGIGGLVFLTKVGCFGYNYRFLFYTNNSHFWSICTTQGTVGFEQHIDRCLEISEYLYNKIKNREGYEMVFESQVCIWSIFTDWENSVLMC